MGASKRERKVRNSELRGWEDRPVNPTLCCHVPKHRRGLQEGGKMHSCVLRLYYGTDNQ